MKKMIYSLATAALIGAPAMAQDDDAFVSFKALKPAVAMELAQAAMQACRDDGYQVGVAVVDRFGTLQVFVRDQYAGVHTIETATRKAWTAVSFRTDTLALAESTAPGSISSGIRMISDALPLGGGVPVEHAGSIVAGIGVSGAPGPDIDDDCARRAIEAIEDTLGF